VQGERRTGGGAQNAAVVAGGPGVDGREGFSGIG